MIEKSPTQEIWQLLEVMQHQEVDTALKKMGQTPSDCDDAVVDVVRGDDGDGWKERRIEKVGVPRRRGGLSRICYDGWDDGMDGLACDLPQFTWLLAILRAASRPDAVDFCFPPQKRLPPLTPAVLTSREG